MIKNYMFNQLPTQEIIDKTKAALEKNGFNVVVAENGKEAKNKVLEMVPKGAEVMPMTSVTLEQIGITKEINESGNYDSVRLKLNSQDTPAREKKRLGAAPEYALGSVHAITQSGEIFVASNTGSQLGAYTFGADHVIWVVGAQKIVPDHDQAGKRIWEYVLPLESERARKAYNLPETYNSYPSKIVRFDREVAKDRITIIFVKEILGF